MSEEEYIEEENVVKYNEDEWVDLEKDVVNCYEYIKESDEKIKCVLKRIEIYVWEVYMGKVNDEKMLKKYVNKLEYGMTDLHFGIEGLGHDIVKLRECWRKLGLEEIPCSVCCEEENVFDVMRHLLPDPYSSIPYFTTLYKQKFIKGDEKIIKKFEKMEEGVWNVCGAYMSAADAMFTHFNHDFNTYQSILNN